jgi:L-ribulokinase
MTRKSFVLGLDFGTDTVRAVVVDAGSGAVAGTAVRPYPRWAKGLYCDPAENRFRHHPLDYLEAMEAVVREALARAGGDVAGRVRGLAADTTGSTPALVDRRGWPLALQPAFAENPDAMFILWKDHTAVAEAERINALARSWGGADYTKYVGSIYSSEWFWAKALRTVEHDPAVAEAAVSIVELCDWIPAVLAGAGDLAAVRRSRCAAGHKALWHAEFGGYPPAAFLSRLHPRLADFAATFGAETWTSDRPFGTISPEWAAKLGLPRDVVIGVGAYDAHMGAVGGGIKPRWMLKIIGTSGLDMLVAPRSAEPEKLVRGICGQVDGSIIPGMTGYEAGQSAFGDAYAWFRDLLTWPARAMVGDAAAQAALAGLEDRVLPALEKAAAELPAGEGELIALDWMNGRRTPDANQRLTGALAGIRLGSDAPRVYRALVEGTAFGSRAIAERFRAEGLAIDGVIAVGGVAKKSPFVMQTLADAMNVEIAISAEDQAVALGAAMFAATAAGLYAQVEDAQRAMSSGTERVYRPDPVRAAVLDDRYEAYRSLGAFAEQEVRRHGR